MEKERVIAPKYKRVAAMFLDVILVFLIWYFLTIKDLDEVNALLRNLDPDTPGALDVFAQALFQMLTAFLLKWLFCQTAYFCFIPALLGKGKTFGKLLFRLSLLDRKTLEVMSPSRLLLREFIGRTIVETLLIVPGIVSLVMTAVSRDGISLRDRIAGTIVVQDSSYLE